MSTHGGDEVGDDVLAELSGIAGHDPRTAALQEMARDVLAGNTTLRRGAVVLVLSGRADRSA